MPTEKSVNMSHEEPSWSCETPRDNGADKARKRKTPPCRSHGVLSGTYGVNSLQGKRMGTTQAMEIALCHQVMKF